MMPEHELLPKVGCGAFIINDQKLLLIKRLIQPEQGHWGLPGGKVDFLEPVETAVQREIFEELAINLTALKLLCVVNQIDAEQQLHWVSPVYLCTQFSGQLKLREPHKHEAYVWFALDQLPEPLTVATIQSLNAYQQLIDEQ